MRPERTVLARTHLCRRPNCKRPGDHARGLCTSCYRATALYVSQGVTSWAILERQGKVEQTGPTLKDWLLS